MTAVKMAFVPFSFGWANNKFGGAAPPGLPSYVCRISQWESSNFLLCKLPYSGSESNAFGCILGHKHTNANFY